MLEEQKYKAKKDILNALNEYFPIGQNDESCQDLLQEENYRLQIFKQWYVKFKLFYDSIFQFYFPVYVHRNIISDISNLYINFCLRKFNFFQ